MSSKATKKRLLPCKEKGERIISMLNAKKAAADVVEFLNTMKFVVNVIAEFCSSKDKERPPVQDDGKRIEKLMKEYEEMLVQIIKTERFVRYFSNNRVRKSLDRLNSQLHKEVAQIYVGLCARKGSAKKPMKDLENQTECITDEEGRRLWETNFQQSIMVEWSRFLDALRKLIEINEDSSKQLKYVLDNSNTGFVSVFKWGEFLNGFGPMRQCIQKVSSVLNADWFHGFLSSKEADKLLESQPIGTYLIRFSKSKPGSFAIAYVDTNGRSSVVTHTLITSAPPSGFKIEEAHTNASKGRLFVTIHEVIQFYNYILKVPFKSDLTRQAWFHGELGAEESEEILAGHPSGTFLFRFSSKSGFLAVSYVVGNKVKHGLLENINGGYKFDNQPPIHSSLQAVVENLPDLLKTPLTSLTFDVSKNSLPGRVNKVAPVGGENYAAFGPQMTASQMQLPQMPGGPSGNRMSMGPPSAMTSSMMMAPGGGAPSAPGSMSSYPPPNRGPSSLFNPGAPPPSPAPLNVSRSSMMPSAGLAPSGAPMGMNPADPKQYGIMPQLQSQANADYGGMMDANQPPNTYGDRTEAANQAQQSEYGDMPSPMAGSPAPAASEYGSPMNVPPVDAPGQYGSIAKAMPKSVGPSVGGAAPPNQYGSMSSISRMTMSMKSTGVGGAPGGMLPGSSLSPDLGAPGTRTTMASPMPPRPGMLNTSGGAGGAPVVDDNYGRMPAPGQGPASNQPAALPPGASDNYGRMPGPQPLRGTTSTASILPGSQLPLANNDNYGRMPGPQPNVSRGPASLTNVQLPAPARGAMPAVNNYGQMPPSISQRPSMALGGSSISPASAAMPAVNNYGAIPQVTRGPPPIAGQYGSTNNIMSSGTYGNTNNIKPGLAPQPLATPGQYGQMSMVTPAAANSQPFVEADYGGLPNEGPVVDSDYGGLPDENGAYSYDQQQAPQHPIVDADYGGLPQTNEDEYGGLQ